MTWSDLGLDPDALPEGLAGLLARFAGSSFTLEGFSGWLLDPDELAEAWRDTRECLPPALLPVANDGGDNHLCVHLGTGALLQHVHDAPMDRHLEPFADSLEPLLRVWGTGAGRDDTDRAD